MHGQRQDHAERMMQPVKGCTEILQENNARTESLFGQDGGIVTAYPGGSIEVSVFNALSSQCKNTIFIWDIGEGPTFTLRYATPAFLRMLRKPPEDVFGQNFEKVMSQDITGQMRACFEECVESQHDVEFVHEHFGCMLITRLCPQVEAGRTVRLIGTNTDITEYIREQSRLKAVSEQLSQQNMLLSTRVKFESIISRALREFMDAGSAGFDGCLGGLNRELGMLMGADQAFILQRYSESLCVHKARWSRDSDGLCPGLCHIRSVYDSRSSLSQLSRMLVINDTDIDRGSPFSQELLQYGVRALLAVPICRDASFYGLFCFAQTASPRVWTTAEISMAKAAADAVMSAYLRIRLENGLCENMRVLTEYDEALQDLLAQKETLAEVSGSFLRADARGFGEWAAKALGDIGRLLDLDGVRAAFHAEGGMDIFRWQENDLPRRIGREYGGLREAALHAASLHAPVAIDDTAEAHPLPQLAMAAADEGLRSLLLVPLCGADSAPGALIGFKAIGVKQWAPAEISVMEAFAQVFSDAYHIKRARENEGPTGTPLQ